MLFCCLIFLIGLLSVSNAAPHAFSQASSPVTTQTTVITAIWTNPGVGIAYCETTSEAFNATQGQTVEGTVTASIPNTLIVYILSDVQYKAWRATNTCDPDDSSGSVWHLGAYRNYVTVANVDWSPAKSGTYWLLAQTYSSEPVVLTVNLNS